MNLGFFYFHVTICWRTNLFYSLRKIFKENKSFKVTEVEITLTVRRKSPKATGLVDIPFLST